MKGLVTSVSILFFLIGMRVTAFGGSVDSPGSPSIGSGMYSLQQIYDYLNSGIEATPLSIFQEPGAAPGATMKTTKQIYDDIKAKMDQCTGIAADMAQGKTFFCTRPGSWGIQTGTAQLVPTPTPTATQTPTPTSTPTSSVYGGLVAYYTLDDTSGAVIDSSGNGNNGANNGAARGVTGKINNAFSFDGADDYVNSTYKPVYDSDTSFSYSFWINSSGTGAKDIIKADDGDFVGCELADGKAFCHTRIGPSHVGVIGTSDVNDSVWHHIVYVYKRNGNMELWVDGVNEASSSTASQGAINISIPLWFGAGNWLGTPTRPYPGKVDEFGIWNRALTGSEIAELWNGGSGKALF